MIYSIKGTVVNEQSQEPIKGAKVSISPIKFVFTDTNGNFTVTGDIPESGSLSMIVNALGYQFIEPPLYKGDNTLKPDLGVLQLQPIVSSLTQDKIKSSQLNKSQIKEISKSKKDLSYYAEEKLSNQVNTLKNTLIPSIITMVAAFGITKVSDYKPEQLPKLLDQSFCPTQAELTSLINRKNKLVKQLNNSLKVIDTTTKVLGITGGIIQSLEIALKLQVAIIAPVPPAANEANRILDKRISQLKSVNAGILSILLILRQVLAQALQLLKLLDAIEQKCYPNADQEQVAL